MSRILVTGAASGLGAAIVDALHGNMNHDVYTFDLASGEDVMNPSGHCGKQTFAAWFDGQVADRHCNASEWYGLDVLINCAGVNGGSYLEGVTREQWDRIVGVNAFGLAAMTQACLPLLRATKGTVLNITSNAAHVPMTASLSYNASKGAADIITLQLARELGRKYGITVFGIAPNKLKGTAMSTAIEEQTCRIRGWTREEAKAYQLAALPAGEETPPERVAEFIAYLLRHKDNHRFLTGTIIPYGA